MNFLVILACAAVFSYVLRKPIRKMPWLFYALAVALNVVLYLNVTTTFPRELRLLTQMLMNKGGLGVAFFVVVMWIGVFPRGGHVSKALRPIRAELSIIACILTAGHMWLYLVTYVGNLLGRSSVTGAVMASLIVAFVLLALVIVLGVTSLRKVKRHMKAASWKKLQNWAYLFYALVLVHVLLIIGPAALRQFGNFSNPAFLNAAVYLAVFGGYMVARVWRFVVDRRDKADTLSLVMDQGFLERGTGACSTSPDSL